MAEMSGSIRDRSEAECSLTGSTEGSDPWPTARESLFPPGRADRSAGPPLGREMAKRMPREHDAEGAHHGPDHSEDAEGVLPPVGFVDHPAGDGGEEQVDRRLNR